MANWDYNWNLSCSPKDTEKVANIIDNIFDRFYGGVDKVDGFEQLIEQADFHPDTEIDTDNGYIYFSQMPDDPYYGLMSFMEVFGQEIPLFSIDYTLDFEEEGHWRLYHIGDGSMMIVPVDHDGGFLVSLDKHLLPDYDQWFKVHLVHEIDLIMSGDLTLKSKGIS